MARILIDENNVVIVWQVVGGGFGDTPYTSVEVENIPEEVKANCEKYCFVNGSFVENSNYNPNYTPPEEPLSEMDEIRLALAELAEIVAGG